MFERLPFCLDALQVAYQNFTRENRVNAMMKCEETELETVPGRSYLNVEDRVRYHRTSDVSSTH